MAGRLQLGPPPILPPGELPAKDPGDSLGMRFFRHRVREDSVRELRFPKHLR